MTQYHTRQYVAHAPEEMFALVADVEAYPQFVPLCEDLRVLERNPVGEGDPARGEILIADMTMAYKLFNETFRSRVTLDPTAPEILVEYLDGPFSHLENRWQFHQAENGGTDVEFFIAYEFRKRSVQFLVGPVFDKVVPTFIKAFENRADQIYGRATARGGV